MRHDRAPVTPLPLLGLRALVALVVVTLLVSGVVGGLLRAGVAVPVPADRAWPGQAVLAHAFLMIGAFLGTVIGIERAVALKHGLAFAAPAASALAGVAMLVGLRVEAGWLAVIASLVFVGVNAAVVARQQAEHTLLLLVAAGAWLVGNLMQSLGSQPAVVVPWWFAFLVLTIAAERLEMTRLMRRRRGAAPLLHLCLGLVLLGAATFAVAPPWGGLIFGLGLFGLAAWLAAFDIARRTLAASGLSRYMAVCLLLGYAWLAVSGLAWMAAFRGIAARDLALHALGLGFVLSMVFAHAPVILPAVARVKLRFGWFFYVPLALLHASLVLRLGAGGLAAGAAGNAAAMALFAATVAGSAIAWRLQHTPASGTTHAHPAPRP